MISMCQQQLTQIVSQWEPDWLLSGNDGTTAATVSTDVYHGIKVRSAVKLLFLLFGNILVNETHPQTEQGDVDYANDHISWTNYIHQTIINYYTFVQLWWVWWIQLLETNVSGLAVFPLCAAVEFSALLQKWLCLK